MLVSLFYFLAFLRSVNKSEPFVFVQFSLYEAEFKGIPELFLLIGMGFWEHRIIKQYNLFVGKFSSEIKDIKTCLFMFRALH